MLIRSEFKESDVVSQWEHSFQNILAELLKTQLDHIRPMTALGQFGLIYDQILFKGMAVCTALPC